MQRGRGLWQEPITRNGGAEGQRGKNLYNLSPAPTSEPAQAQALSIGEKSGFNGSRCLSANKKQWPEVRENWVLQTVSRK
jgi:hypothetical protein